MKGKGAIMYVKGDWVEFSDRFGYPGHGSVTRPCFCCNTFPGPNMFNPHLASLLETPWSVNTDEDFETAFQRFEIRPAALGGAKKIQ